METDNPLKFFIDLADLKLFEPEEKKEPNEVKAVEQKSEGETVDLRDINELLEHLNEDILGRPYYKNNPPSNRSYDEIDVNPSFSYLYNKNISNYWNNTYFKYNLPDKLAAEKTHALQAMDIVLLGITDIGKMVDKISELTFSIDSVISKLDNYDEAKRYPGILKSCIEIRDDLQTKKKLIGNLDRTKQNTSTDKIQWLGQLNVLSTLFYHLLKGQDGGDPYIKAPVEEVKRMLVANFIDRDGHEISAETLKTHFTPARSEKRANEGDRIELPNKKPKK